MKEEKKTITRTVNKQVMWQFLGKSLKWKGQILIKGSTFMAYPHEISNTFRDLIIPMNEVTESTTEKPKTQPFMDRKAGAWYDVYDADGEKVNERNLRKEDAEKLLEILVSKTTEKEEE